MKKVLALSLAIMMVFAVMVTPAFAAGEYPSKQINVICPLGAGGASDAISRLYAAALEEVVGVSVVVENKPGAGTGIGLEAVASSDPDGYTLGYMPAEVTTVKAMGNAEVTPADFIFLGNAMKIRALLAVPAASKWNTLEEFIADAKANPGEIVLGTAGVGNAYELGLRQLMKSADIDLNIVNFSDGTAAAIAAMLGGNVEVCTCGTSEALSYVKSGEFKLLCNLSDERSFIFPDVPTATELGYPCNGQSWGAFAVPAGTPDDIVEFLRDATAKAIDSEAFQAALDERGFDEAYIPGAEFQSMAEEMSVTNSAIIEEFDLSVN